MAFVRADEFQFGFLLLSSSSVFQLGFGFGQRFFKYRHIAKQCPLPAITQLSIKFKKMKNRFSVKIILLFCLLLSQSVVKTFSQRKPSKVDKEKLSKLEYDWIVAEFKLDTVVLSSILDESFISIDDTGILDKQQELKEVYESVIQMRKSEHLIDSLYLDSVHIQTYKKFAVVTFIAVTKGRIKNIPFQNRRTRFYDVWIKKGGDWKAVSSQVTRLH
jgi:hypothetical protein